MIARPAVATIPRSTAARQATPVADDGAAISADQVQAAQAGHQQVALVLQLAGQPGDERGLPVQRQGDRRLQRLSLAGLLLVVTWEPRRETVRPR